MHRVEHRVILGIEWTKRNSYCGLRPQPITPRLLRTTRLAGASEKFREKTVCRDSERSAAGRLPGDRRAAPGVEWRSHDA
jgi:hypothetical protein